MTKQCHWAPLLAAGVVLAGAWAADCALAAKTSKPGAPAIALAPVPPPPDKRHGKAKANAAATPGAQPGAAADLQLDPGKETRIEDPAIGGAGYYVIYVPKDYTPERSWPAIFCYHGLNGKPTAYPFHAVLGGKGFVIIGMEYYGTGMDAFKTVSTDVQTLRRMVQDLGPKLKLDPKQLFIGGFSQGGWMTSSIAEATGPLWAGVVITGAGRHGGGTIPESAGFRGKKMYIGAGEKDDNFSSAQKAADFYKSQGADVTFEAYAGMGHSVDTKSKVFADWLWSNGPLKRVMADLAEAKALQAAGKLGQAYAKFSQAAAVPGDHEACKEAAAAAAAIGKDAGAQLAAADGAVGAKNYGNAIGAFSRAAALYGGSKFGEQADKSLAALLADPAVQDALGTARQNVQARTLQEQAQAAELAKDYALAIRLYEQLAAVCPKSDFAPAARARADALKADKAVAASIREREAQRDCRGWLSMADNFIQAGHPDQAREYLKKIIDKYPDTEWEKQARERLARLK